MAHVFISYSRKDSVYAHQLANELSKWGIDAWIDNRIDYGANWPMALQENLDACPIFIVIMSPNSFKSKWVHDELSYAQGKQKTILPIRLESVDWLTLASTQPIDARDGKLPKKEFFSQLQRVLGIDRPVLINDDEIIVSKNTDLRVQERPSRSREQHFGSGIWDSSYKPISDALKTFSKNEGIWKLGHYEIECKKFFLGRFILTLRLYDDLVSEAGGKLFIKTSDYGYGSLGDQSKPVEFKHERGSRQRRSGNTMTINHANQFLDAAKEMVDLYKKSGLDPEELLDVSISGWH